MEFSRQEDWSELPFPPLGDIPDLEIEPVSPDLAGGFFTSISQEMPTLLIRDQALRTPALAGRIRKASGGQWFYRYFHQKLEEYQACSVPSVNVFEWMMNKTVEELYEVSDTDTQLKECWHLFYKGITCWKDPIIIFLLHGRAKQNLYDSFFSILENNFIEINLPAIQFTRLKCTICKYTLFSIFTDLCNHRHSQF